MAIQIKSSDVAKAKSYLDSQKKQEVNEKAKAYQSQTPGNYSGTNEGGNNRVFTPTKGSTNRATVMQTLTGPIDPKTNRPKTVYQQGSGIFRFINLDVFPQQPQSRWTLHNGDARLLVDCWVKDDDGKNMHVIYPFEDPYSEYFMADNNPFIDWINTVLTKSEQWVETNELKADGKKKKKKKTVYIYENRKDHGLLEGTADAEGMPTIADVTKFVLKGGDPSTMAKGLVGSRIMVCNCIDRKDMEYHRKEKMFKLFAQSIDMRDPGKIRYKDATKSYLYDGLSEHLADFKYEADFNAFDVLIYPKYAGFGDKDSNFRVEAIDVSERKQTGYITDLKKVGFTEEDLAFVSTDNFLTEEEMSWEPVDIDKAYPVTAMNVIAKRLKNPIIAWDKMFGTDFFPRIQAIAEKEVAAYAAAKKAEEAAQEEPEKETPASAPVQESATPANASFDTMEDVADPLDAMQARPVAGGRPQAPAPDAASALDFSNLKGMNLLTDEEKALIDFEGMTAAIGTPNAAEYFDDNGKVKQLKFFDNVKPIYSCSNLGPNHDEGCGALNPFAFKYCAHCGYKY